MAFVVETELRMVGQELLDDLSVLDRFQAAGAIDECAARFQPHGRLLKQAGLELSQSGRFLGSEAPAQVHAPT